MTSLHQLTRIRCIDMLSDLLVTYTPEEIEQIESSLYQKNPINTELYIRNAKRTCHNLLFMPKQTVLKYINSDSTSIAYVSDANLRGPTLQSFMNEERERYDDTLRMLYDKVEEGSVASLKQKAAVVCSKCNSSNVIMSMAQTRSADEGTTMFFTCVDCNKKWKVQ